MSNSIKKILLGERKGSLAVEAAIFLPIFIIGMLTIGYLVKFCAVQENVYHSFTDETGKVAAEAELYDIAPVFYENDLKKRINEENGTEIRDFDLSNFRYRIPTLGYDNIILATLDYDVDIRLPLRFIEKIPVSDSIVTRAFVGNEQNVEPMPFDEMEEELDSDTVWVFPISGSRYHMENCNYIVNEPKERMLTAALKNQYSPCKLCDPEDLSYGNLVYCFSTGSVYHKGACATVTKYVTAMEKKEAIDRGYTPCLRCGGSDG